MVVKKRLIPEGLCRVHRRVLSDDEKLGKGVFAFVYVQHQEVFLFQVEIILNRAVVKKV
jgi:hypothetical protein